MQDAPNFQHIVRENFLRALKRKIADTNQPFRFQRSNDFPQMVIACSEERYSLGRRQFVRRAIASGSFHESERAVVHHKMRRKKTLCAAEALGKSPQRR